MNRLQKLFAASLLVGVLTSAYASPVTFSLSWSGASFGNSASATGDITLDTAILNNPSFGQEFLGVPSAQVLDLNVTVTGASSGNGVFTIADFNSMYWNTGGVALNLGAELVGQATTANPWGTNDGGASGDFNIFTSNGVSPTGTIYFTLTTAGGGGDRMLLTSMSAVPEGGMTLTLTGLAFVGIALIRRKLNAA